EYVEWFETNREQFNRWAQTYLVLTLCRLLFTTRTGAVAGKAEGAAWGERELDPAWASLIRRALAERGDPSVESRIPADPDAHAAIRSTSAGSGSPTSSGSVSMPAWCAPTFRPYTGSWSENIACARFSCISTIDGGTVSCRKNATVSRVTLSGKSGKKRPIHEP